MPCPWDPGLLLPLDDTPSGLVQVRSSSEQGSHLYTHRVRTCCLCKALPGLALVTAVLQEHVFCARSSFLTPECALWRGPTSLCLRPCGVTCARYYTTWSRLLRVTLELWASVIQVTELLHVSSSLGSTPSSIIKASGVLWCIS